MASVNSLLVGKHHLIHIYQEEKCYNHQGEAPCRENPRQAKFQLRWLNQKNPLTIRYAWRSLISLRRLRTFRNKHLGKPLTEPGECRVGEQRGETLSFSLASSWTEVDKSKIESEKLKGQPQFPLPNHCSTEELNSRYFQSSMLMRFKWNHLLHPSHDAFLVQANRLSTNITRKPCRLTSSRFIIRSWFQFNISTYY